METKTPAASKSPGALKAICARCGKSGKPMAGSLCAECFAQANRLYSIPELVAEKCAVCGKMRLGGIWVDEGRLAEWVKHKIKPGYPVERMDVSIRPTHKGAVADLSLAFNVRGMRVEIEQTVPIKVELNQCLNCSRIAAGYHEAIIQLRGPHEKIESKGNKLIHLIERTSFISSVKHKKEGVDLEVGSRLAAQNALTRLGLPQSATYKLITRKQGKDVYRTTYCVRL